jgi:hypothetical protein
LLKKTMILLVVGAVAVFGLALIAGPAAGKRICSKGQPKKAPYCATQCVVPKVVGKHLDEAKQLITAANCRVGKITKRDLDKNCETGKTKCKSRAANRARKLENGFEDGIVVKQSRRPGSGRSCQPGTAHPGHCLSTKTKINLIVEF